MPGSKKNGIGWGWIKSLSGGVSPQGVLPLGLAESERDMEQPQEYEPLAAARREALLIARLVLWGWHVDLLRASAPEAWRAVAWYVERVGWSESSIALWYREAEQSAAEQQAFFQEWQTWQQAQRQRLGKGALVGAGIESEG
jgi:hypothetical protein